MGRRGKECIQSTADSYTYSCSVGMLARSRSSDEGRCLTCQRIRNIGRYLDEWDSLPHPYLADIGDGMIHWITQMEYFVSFFVYHSLNTGIISFQREAQFYSIARMTEQLGWGCVYSLFVLTGCFAHRTEFIPIMKTERFMSCVITSWKRNNRHARLRDATSISEPIELWLEEATVLFKTHGGCPKN